MITKKRDSLVDLREAIASMDFHLKRISETFRVAQVIVCRDCGEEGESTGHQDCQKDHQ